MPTKIDKKILIVEDETPLRNAVSDILTFEGFGVLQAKNGQEGLDIALAEHPDLIVLDIMMPVMDGMASLRKIREDESWGKNAHIVFFIFLQQ